MLHFSAVFPPQIQLEGRTKVIWYELGTDETVQVRARQTISSQLSVPAVALSRMCRNASFNTVVSETRW